jgi:hypothetical protein
VHASTAPAATAGCFAVEFGHHDLRIYSFGNRVPVSTVRAGDLILRLQVRADPDCDSFLSDVKVNKTRHPAGLVLLLSCELKMPDQDHLLIQLKAHL